MKFSDIPFDKIVKVGNKGFLYNDLFNINWVLGRYCNYSCSYCWPYAHTNKKDYRDFSVIKRTIDDIFKQAGDRNYHKFYFSFSGGEPTFHPNFLEILEYIGSSNIRMNITSNCSRSLEWFKELTDICKRFSQVTITASFHPEFAKREEFLQKIKLLEQGGINAPVNIVMLNNHFDQMWNEAEYFDGNGVIVQPKIQIDYINNETIERTYTNQQLDKLKNGFPRLKKINYPFEMEDKDGKKYYVDNVERVLALNFNRFEGWICEAGYRGIVISEPQGSIRRHYLCKDKPLGHIERGFKLYDKPRECITKICGSSANCKIPKFKNKEIYNAFLSSSMDSSSHKK